MNQEANQALEALIRLDAPLDIYTKRCGTGVHYVKERNSGLLLAKATKKNLSRKARLKYGKSGDRWNLQGLGLLASRPIYKGPSGETVIEYVENTKKGIAHASIISIVQRWLDYIPNPERRWVSSL